MKVIKYMALLSCGLIWTLQGMLPPDTPITQFANNTDKTIMLFQGRLSTSVIAKPGEKISVDPQVIHLSDCDFCYTLGGLTDQANDANLFMCEAPSLIVMVKNDEGAPSLIEAKLCVRSGQLVVRSTENRESRTAKFSLGNVSIPQDRSSITLVVAGNGDGTMSIGIE